MPAFKKDLYIEKGATFSLNLTKKDTDGDPIDLTGYTARFKAAQGYNVLPIILDLTTENGGITLGGTAGTIAITASATATAAINLSELVYDLELTLSGVVQRLLQGKIIISPQV